MPLARGKKNIYVGMELDYGTPREVIVLMDIYITKAIDEFLEETMKSIKTPAGNHPFKVEEACKKLYNRDNIILRRLVSNIISLSKGAGTDIQPTITFLTTRVINPDKDNWKNIRRVLSYLDATINTVNPQLNANNLNVVHLWVDASYGTHPDLKGQTGATISIGKVCVTSA